MSDHQFQEHEFEGGEGEPADMTDLMDLLMEGPLGHHAFGALGQE
jgi:hypothetical protein